MSTYGLLFILSQLVSFALMSQEDLSGVLCNETIIEEYFILPKPSSSNSIKEALCNLNATTVLDDLPKAVDLVDLVTKVNYLYIKRF